MQTNQNQRYLKLSDHFVIVGMILSILSPVTGGLPSTDTKTHPYLAPWSVPILSNQQTTFSNIWRRAIAQYLFIYLFIHLFPGGNFHGHQFSCRKKQHNFGRQIIYRLKNYTLFHLKYQEISFYCFTFWTYDIWYRGGLFFWDMTKSLDRKFNHITCTEIGFVIR